MILDGSRISDTNSRLPYKGSTISGNKQSI